jgi:L-lysine 2,3-aminomutase
MKWKCEEAKREIFRQNQLKEKIDCQLENIKRKQEREEQLKEEATSLARQFHFQMDMDSPQKQLIKKLVFKFRELHAEVEAELQELKEKNRRNNKRVTRAYLTSYDMVPALLEQRL